MSKLRIFIDPGHGGSNRGTIGPHGWEEKNVNLQLSELVSIACKREGWIIRWSRTDDYDLPNLSRAKAANLWEATAFISIHCNGHESPAAQGHETLYWFSSRIGALLAGCIELGLKEYLPGRPSRSVKPVGIGDRGETVLRRTVMPSVIVEPGFLTNEFEEQLLTSLVSQAKIALAVRDGIRHCFL